MRPGTFSVARSIWDHPEFKQGEFSEREAFLWLVSEAAWEASTVRAGRVVVGVERGQLCASVRFIATAWGWSKSRVFRYFLRLEKRDMLRTESGTGQLVITVCNYDKFQFGRDTSGTRAGHKPGHERDKEKEVKKRKKDICPIGAVETDFDRFWNAFADKRGRPSAERAFAKAIKSTDPEVIIAGATRYAATRKSGFWKMAQGWLRDERWNDGDAQPTAVDDHLKSWGISDAKYDGPGQRVEHCDAAERRQPADVPGMFEFEDAPKPESEMLGDHGKLGWDRGVLSPLRMDEGS